MQPIEAVARRTPAANALPIPIAHSAVILAPELAGPSYLSSNRIQAELVRQQYWLTYSETISAPALL